jgi:protocadherin Fat 1/2/3
MDETAMVSIATDVLSFVGPRHVHEPVCHCHEGFAGDNCDQIMNECAKKPCPDHKLCIPVENSELGYKCSCPVGMVGEVSFIYPLLKKNHFRVIPESFQSHSRVILESF